MSLKSRIIDPSTGAEAAVVHDHHNKPALLVATRPYKSYNIYSDWFTNPTHSNQIAQNVGFSGTPEVIYDENDNWTTSSVTGSWIFNSTSSPHGGIYCIDGYSTGNNDEMKLVRSSDLTMSSVVAVTGYVYIGAWSTSGTKELGIKFANSSGSTVGNRVNVGEYINKYSFGTWQQFNIPISNFGASGLGIRELRFDTVDLGPGNPIDFRLDDIQLEESGGGLTYTLNPPTGSLAYLREIRGTFIDEWTGNATNGDMPNLSYNKIVGLDNLVNGIIFRIYSGGMLASSYTVNNISDMLSQTGSEIVTAFQDDTNTFLSISWKFPRSILLHSSLDDKIDITIQDNMSGLISLKMQGLFDWRPV